MCIIISFFILLMLTKEIFFYEIWSLAVFPKASTALLLLNTKRKNNQKKKQHYLLFCLMEGMKWLCDAFILKTKRLEPKQYQNKSSIESNYHLSSRLEKFS